MNERTNKLIESKKLIQPDKLIEYSLSNLRGLYSQQKAFHITLGVATIVWMKNSERYRYAGDRISTALLYDDNFGIEVKMFEDEFLEFRGILSTLLSTSFENTDNRLKEVYYRLLNNDEIRTLRDAQELVNQTVDLGFKENNFSKTPKSVSQLVAKLSRPENINCFAAYCAGVSNIALEIFRQTNHQPHYYAEEINMNISIISKLLMLVNGIKNYEINNKDVFSKEEFGEYRGFDFVVSEIPRASGYNRTFNPTDLRFRYGVPGRGNQEWAFIQNIIHHLNNRGLGIAIGSKGMLVRGFEGYIRARIIEEDLIECVITLPDNLYEGTNIGTEILIVNPHKPATRLGGVLFINAHQYRERLNRYQHTLTEEGTEKILEAYFCNREIEGFSKFVPLEKIREYDHRLNPIEYIDFESLKNQFDKTVPLDEIAEISRGASVTKKELEELENDGEYYYISIKNIDDNGINYNDAMMIRPKDRNWLERYRIEEDDIIITTKGWETRVALVGKDFKDSIISSNLTRVRVDRRKYNPYILVEFLKSSIGKKMLESIQTGTTITLINNKQLSRMEVPIYPRELMDEIGKDIEENQKIYEERIRDAENEYEENRARLIKKLGLTEDL